MKGNTRSRTPWHLSAPLLGLTASALAAFSGMAAAQPTLSAQSIIVNPAPSAIGVRVWTDRDSSGTRTPGYAPGERIRLYTSVTQDAYVYLFNVDPSGQVDLILPNKYQGGANFLKANTVKVFPSAGDPFTFDIATPYGVNKVLALASKTPLNLNQIATFKAEQNTFASVKVQGQQGLAQALSIVVNPVPQNTWNSATAFYQVVAAVATTPPRPSPIQPAPQPVNPAPPTVQPLSVNVTPRVQTPWGSAREWQTTVDARSDLRALHADYAKKLQAEGYVLRQTRVKNNEIQSQFSKPGGGKAELSVKRKGNRVEIKVERD